MTPVVFQISGRGAGNAFCPVTTNPQSPMPQHEIHGAQLRFDQGQPVSPTAAGKPIGELSLFRPDSSVSTYGQVNKIAEKTDNSLEIKGVLYYP